MTRFEDILEGLDVKAEHKSKFVEAYPALHEYAEANFKNTKKWKQTFLNKLNYLIYVLYVDGVVMYNWSDVVSLDEFSYDENPTDVALTISPNFLDIENVDWSYLVSRKFEKQLDLDGVSSSDAAVVVSASEEQPSPLTKGIEERESNESVKLNVTDDLAEQKDQTSNIREEGKQSACLTPTPKEDLFIATSKYPRVAGFHYKYGNVHVSLPQVPTKQSEVSCTTDVNGMTNKELLALFPNRFVRTRSPLMYEEKDGITLDPEFGLLIPVDGFTDSEVRDCVIRYPHIFKLKRVGPDGELISFYNHIEIDGELVDALEAWSFLPEAKVFDFDSMETRQEQMEFMKEYAIRRYLLERDVKHVVHKYPVVGDLPEFVTLFMPADMYVREGYGDPVDLAKKCVIARSDYLKSRNPRLGKNVTVKDCVFDSFCTRSICDRSCPQWAQMDYLMMRNSLTSSSRPFMMKTDALRKYVEAYERCEGVTGVLETSDTVRCAETMSYVAVCNAWSGSAMRVRAYHLLYSKYIQNVQDSWSGRKSDELEYTEIWAKSSNVLVVSDLDYVNFKDFQSQVLLQLLQDREREGKTTIVVSPRIDYLAGSGQLYSLLVSKLKRNSFTVD